MPCRTPTRDIGVPCEVSQPYQAGCGGNSHRIAENSRVVVDLVGVAARLEGVGRPLANRSTTGAFIQISRFSHEPVGITSSSPEPRPARVRRTPARLVEHDVVGHTKPAAEQVDFEFARVQAWRPPVYLTISVPFMPAW